LTSCPICWRHLILCRLAMINRWCSIQVNFLTCLKYKTPDGVTCKGGFDSLVRSVWKLVFNWLIFRVYACRITTGCRRNRHLQTYPAPSCRRHPILQEDWNYSPTAGARVSRVSGNNLYNTSNSLNRPTQYSAYYLSSRKQTLLYS
jgi:hypothetical protein